MSISKRNLFLLVVFVVVAALLLSQVNTGTTAAMNIQPESIRRSGSTGYVELIFSDEFDGEGLDTNKWANCYWWDNNGCTNMGNNELQWYLPENISASGGTLKLTAQKRTVQGTTGITYPYTSGIVTTGRLVDSTLESARFPFLYGYVEVRAKIPAGKGLWPAIWMLPSDQVSKPEIDVMEVIGDDTKTVHMNFHYEGANGQAERSQGHWVSDEDLAGEWHTYGVDWEPDHITWYIDGIARRHYTDVEYIPNRPMYLLMNLAVGGNWPGAPDANTVFPSSFEIDYVRIWKPAVSTVLIASQDAYVDEEFPDQNFGRGRTLHADGSPERVTYLKFDIPALTGRRITSAILRVRTSGEDSAGSENSQAVYVVNDTWDENSITFNNRPPIETYIIGTLDHTEQNISYDIQLTPSEIQKMVGRTLSLAVVQTGYDGFFIYSREFRPFYPELILTTTTDLTVGAGAGSTTGTPEAR